MAKVLQQLKARQLRSRGFSLNEIAKQLNASKSSISVWVRHVRLGFAQIQRLRQREIDGVAKSLRVQAKTWAAYHKLHPKPVSKGPRWPQRSVEHFFDRWSPDMAYVLGYFAADGTMYKNKRGSCYVAFTSTDKVQIELVVKIMKINNAIEAYQPRQKNNRRRYTIQIGSKKLYQRLLSLGFTPNKSLTLRFPDIPDNCLCHFARGYLDGDGCAHFGIYQRKNRLSKRALFNVSFISGSRPFLKKLQRRLHLTSNLGLGSLSQHGRAYRLSYVGHNARQLYGIMYPITVVPCLQRKKAVFIKAIDYWARSSMVERLPVTQ